MPILVKIVPMVLEKKIFQISSVYFCYFVIIPPPPLEKGEAVYLKNLNPLYPRMLFVPSGSGEKMKT